MDYVEYIQNLLPYCSI